DPAAARAWLDAELASLVAMAAHGATRGWPAHAVRLSAVLFRYLDGQHDVAALSIHEHARAAARTIGDRVGEAQALTALGVTHTRGGRRGGAGRRLGEAFALYMRAGDQLGQARVLGNLGMIAERTGRYPAAADHYEQALVLFRLVGDPTGEAHALTRLGTA